MVEPDPFAHLSDRCSDLIKKYASPIIQAEEDAVKKGLPLPDPDLDQLVALRLIAHAELEGYFEAKAQNRLNELRDQLVSRSLMTVEHAALIFLYLQKKEIIPVWSTKSLADERSIKLAELADFKNLASAAFGFANDYIASNNGIKESSIHMLAAISGRFPGDLSTTLVAELNQLGIDRGAVAHKSWLLSKKANVQSATVEKNRIEALLELIRQTFEPSLYAKRESFIRDVSPLQRIAKLLIEKTPSLLRKRRG